jgi:hypothetical protein
MTLTTLSDDYRAEQDRLNRVAAARLLSVFPALNLKDIDRSAPGWVYAVERVTQDHHQKSQQLAADLYSSYRREAGATNRVSFVFSDMNGGKLRASLTYEGAYAGKHMLATGQRIPEVARLLYGHTSGIALRHGQDGGRDLVMGTGRADQSTTGFGYIRMTSASPCGFCALKALGVYNSEATAGQDYHDHDKCYPLPRVKDALPDGYADRMAQFQGVYEESVAFKTNREGRLVTDGEQTIRNMNRLMRAA